MKTRTTILLIGALVMGLATFPQNAVAEDPKPIGTYDSRAIAVAFVGSEVYKETRGKLLASKMEEHNRAKKEGDQEKVEEIEAWGKSQQELLHKQGFSTASVDDILTHISDQLPGIKKQADVEFLVSKWDEKTLEEHKAAERVDVTLLLIEAFKPMPLRITE